MKQVLLFCGFFPKPISGNSFITMKLYNYLKKHSKIEKVDFGNLNLDKNLNLQKFKKLLINFFYLLNFNEKFQIYYVKNDGKKNNL